MVLSQGIDIESTNRYNYSYIIDSHQVFVESKFLFKINTFSPYLSVGLGEAFNDSKSYRSSVPEFVEFTPDYANHKQKKLAYSLGTGLDLPLGGERPAFESWVSVY